MNIQLGSGKVHAAHETPGYMPAPECGGNRAVEGYRTVKAEVNCKNCLKITAAKVAETEGEIMAAKNTETVEVDESLADALGEDAPEMTPERAAVEQISANIERARSLAEAENVEGLAELSKENETLISSLPTRGKIPAGDMTWAAFKQDARARFREAAQAQPKPEPKGTAVATKAEAAPDVTTDYTMTEGVKDIVNAGADLVREGVHLHVKQSQTARQIATMLLDTRRRIVKDGVPDLKANTQAARNASADMYAKAEQVLAAESGDKDHAASLVKKLGQSVRNVMSDVLVAYVKELDTSTEEWQQHYGKVAAAHPELSPSEAVFKFYDINPISRRELAAQRQADRTAKLRELEAAASEGNEEAAEAVEELKAATVQERIAGDIQTVEKALKAAIKAAADLSEEDKNALKAKAAELLALVAAL